jgi:carbamate kinase
MAPKVEAACRFAERTGRIAGIGAIDQAEAILAGGAGTIVAMSGGANDSV